MPRCLSFERPSSRRSPTRCAGSPARRSSARSWRSRRALLLRGAASRGAALGRRWVRAAAAAGGVTTRSRSATAGRSAGGARGDRTSARRATRGAASGLACGASLRAGGTTTGRSARTACSASLGQRCGHADHQRSRRETHRKATHKFPPCSRIRDAFVDALKAYYQTHGVVPARANLLAGCHLLWNCSDVLPAVAPACRACSRPR
jgi:hypothetical protein